MVLFEISNFTRSELSFQKNDYQEPMVDIETCRTNTNKDELAYA